MSPTTPQKEAGIRIDPPVSVPVAISAMPVATATPEPPLEPPGVRLRVVGVANRPEVRIVGGDAVRQFVQSGLAEHHRPGGCELFRYRRIAVRDIIREEFRPGRRANPLGPDEVFMSDGDAMQQAAIRTGGELAIQAGCTSPRGVFGNRQEGVERWI